MDKLNLIIDDKNIELEVLDLKDWKLENNNEQDVFPYFTGKNEETVKLGVPTYRRYSVIAIIKHNKEDKYLCVDAKKHLCKSFVLGGIDEGETSQQAALREIKEETGYTDVKIEYTCPFTILNHFYAGYKGDFNRLSTLYIVLGKLKSGKNIGISENENNKHVVKWIDRNELESFLNLEHNRFAMKFIDDKDATYTGKGIKFVED